MQASGLQVYTWARISQVEVYERAREICYLGILNNLKFNVVFVSFHLLGTTWKWQQNFLFWLFFHNKLITGPRASYERMRRGNHYFNLTHTKGIPFLTGKMVYKMIRGWGWTSERSLPVWKFVQYPLPGLEVGFKELHTNKLTSTTDTMTTNTKNRQNVSAGSGTYGISVPGTVKLFTMFSTRMPV